MEAIVAQLASESEELHQVSGGCGNTGGGGGGHPLRFAVCRLLQAFRVGAWPRPTLPALPRPQVVSSILRNLSWRADINSKKVLREVGSMTALMQCVLRATKVGVEWGGWEAGQPGWAGGTGGEFSTWGETKSDNPLLGNRPTPGASNTAAQRTCHS